MSKPILSLDLGKPPPSGNSLIKAHWRKQQGYRTKWRERMAAAIAVARCERADDIPIQSEDERWLLVIRWYAKRPPQDTHPNCCIAVKPIVDAISGDLSVERILWDDNDGNLKIEFDKRKTMKGEPERLRFDFYEMKKDGAFDWGCDGTL